MKNFRDKWVGSSEGNLEKIFRLIHALGRCYVFIDEADQALGRRDSASGDSGVGGRIYSMLAEEIGGSTNRGRVIWVLASGRPDLIEVDLKRPGRVDVKIPLSPTTTPREGFDLIRMLCGKRGLAIPGNGLRFPGIAHPAASAPQRRRSIRCQDLPPGTNRHRDPGGCSGGEPNRISESDFSGSNGVSNRDRCKRSHFAGICAARFSPQIIEVAAFPIHGGEPM